MIVSILAAVDEEGGIGRDNRIPWKAPADLRWFKQATMGHHLIMGRKTWESIGKALLGRTSIVLTRNPDYQAQEALVAHSLEQALKIAAEAGDSETFIIGGAEIFEQGLPLSNRMYLTRVHTTSTCDVYFPDFPIDEWDKVEETSLPADGTNPIALTFMVFHRKPANTYHPPD